MFTYRRQPKEEDHHQQEQERNFEELDAETRAVSIPRRGGLEQLNQADGID
jgi:hypothetical protein